MIGIVIKSSKGGHTRYIRISTLSKVIIPSIGAFFFFSYIYIIICLFLNQRAASKSLLLQLRIRFFWQNREGHRSALRHLAASFLNVEIQSGEHCPVSILSFSVTIMSAFCTSHSFDVWKKKNKKSVVGFSWSKIFKWYQHIVFSFTHSIISGRRCSCSNAALWEKQKRLGKIG